ncbi:MAG: TIGR00269 family protein [Candidatus ainarchaeum sp.]|nr:TIGR00269 family protein [Candidatus ainarchaeum sp.]
MKKPACSACGKPAVINLAYAARHLCAGCFVKYFEKRFLDTVREFRMIKPRERVAVGVSGGKDSMVLLHLLAKLRKRLPFEIVAITIDEGIAGYRSRTLAVAKRECKKLKVPLRVLSFRKGVGFSLDEIMKKEGSACSWCGVFRRYLLNKGARKERASKIAIGHNLDDVAQTVLMNIMRNEPARLARFLEPISEDDAFVPRIRPLMRAPEKEIAAYAMLKGIRITYSECPYAYQSFRQHVKGQLNETEEKYPGTKIRILNSFIWMEKLMEKEGEKSEILKCSGCGEPSSRGLCMACKMIERLGARQ